MSQNQIASPSKVRKFCGEGGCEHYRGPEGCVGWDRSRVSQELAVVDGRCDNSRKYMHNGRMTARPDGTGEFNTYPIVE